MYNIEVKNSPRINSAVHSKITHWDYMKCFSYSHWQHLHFQPYLHGFLMLVRAQLSFNMKMFAGKLSEQKDPELHFIQLVCWDVRCFKYSKADACILALKSRLTHKSRSLSLGRCLERLMFHGSAVQQLTTAHNLILSSLFTGHLKGNKVKQECVGV